MVAALALSCITITACEPDEPEEQKPTAPSQNSLYVLCEGNWGQNNSAIDLFSIDNNGVTKDFFNLTNGFGLGDTGNDMIAYGSKVYVAVKISGVVTVFNRQDGKQIKRIVMRDYQDANKMPSRLCSSNGKVYVACFDGTVVEIDTSSLNIERQVNVGRNPDGITLANNKLFVSNSGGLDVVFDSTISVISLPDFAVSTINVGLNPTIARTLPDGNVMVMLNGNYYDINPSLVTIDSHTNDIIRRDNVGASSFAIFGNSVVYLYYNYLTSSSSVKVAPYNNISAGSADFIKQSAVFNSVTTPYCFSVNTSRHEIYLTDAKDYQSSGEVLCFDYNGNLKYRFQTSNNPTIVLQR
jgi:hypothetical protein